MIDDHQQLFSAASVALFGCEDLYMMVRAVAASEVESNPERYKKAPPRLLVELRDFGRPVDADAALVALANATGVHFALHVASDGGTPHAFRPDGYAGPSAGAPAYVLCRLPGNGPLRAPRGGRRRDDGGGARRAEGGQARQQGGGEEEAQPARRPSASTESE